MPYNSDRKGYETKDGGLIRVNGSGEKVRIDLYNGDERKSKHSRDSIHYDTKKGSGRIDSHNEDKSKKSSTDTSCYLTSACMKHYLDTFDDNCYELRVLRWFRDNFVSEEDKEHYYQTAPVIVEAIEQIPDNNVIYNAIYQNVISFCVSAIERSEYELAYRVYKDSVLYLEEKFARKELQKRLVRVFRKVNNSNQNNQ